MQRVFSVFSGPRAWVGVFILTLLIAGSMSLISGEKLRFSDERDYHGIAQRLLESGTFTNQNGKLSAFRPPGYPALLSGLYAVWDSPLAAKLLNAFALAFSGLLLGVMVERVVRGAGLIAAGIVAIYPLFVFTSTTLYPQVIGLFFLSLATLLLLSPNRRLLHSVGAGIVFGLLILTISSFMLFVPLIALWLAWQPPRLRRSSLLQAIVFAIVAALVVMPWTVRNWQVFGAVVPVSTNGGFNLLLGNNENAGPNTGVMADIRRYQREAAASTNDEVSKDAFFKSAAVRWIEENPLEAAQLYVAKWLNHWNFSNETKTLGAASFANQTILFISFYPLLAIVLLRLIWWRKVPLTPAEGLLYFLIVVNAFVSAIFFTRVRFRLPFDGLLIALAAMAIGHWWQLRRAESRESAILEPTR